jgi:hypothetical protein
MKMVPIEMRRNFSDNSIVSLYFFSLKSKFVAIFVEHFVGASVVANFKARQHGMLYEDTRIGFPTAFSMATSVLLVLVLVCLPIILTIRPILGISNNVGATLWENRTGDRRKQARLSFVYMCSKHNLVLSFGVLRSGIGRATAKLLAAEGACVAATGRNAANLDTLVSEITASGGVAGAFPADVTDDAAVSAGF